jgi:hypothetical protein
MIVSQCGARAQTERQGGYVTTRIFAIALQALGVAALGAVVYFAFLHPSDPNPLSGIQVDGDIPAAGVTPGNGQATGQRSRETPARRGDRTRTLAGIRLVPVQPGDVAPGPPGPPVDGDTPTGSQGDTPTGSQGDTPTGSQYGSAVTRVLGRVARAER